MSTPTATNSVANFVNDLIIKFIAGDEVVLQNYIAVQIPFLEAPVVRIFTNQVIGYICDSIRKNITQLATAIVVDIQVNGEQSALNLAFKNLQAAIQGGNQDAITKAQKAFMDAAANLAHSDGASTNAS